MSGEQISEVLNRFPEGTILKDGWLVLNTTDNGFTVAKANNINEVTADTETKAVNLKELLKMEN
mgnify:CR=1 FL=1